MILVQITRHEKRLDLGGLGIVDHSLGIGSGFYCFLSSVNSVKFSSN